MQKLLPTILQVIGTIHQAESGLPINPATATIHGLLKALGDDGIRADLKALLASGGDPNKLADIIDVAKRVFDAITA